MKIIPVLIGIILSGSVLPAVAQDFDRYFTHKSLRFDYYRCGNASEEHIYFDKLREEPYWGGSEKNLIDPFDYGNHFVKVFDKKSGKLIYSRGYCSLFNEWQTTAEAKTTNRCYPEAVNLPYPKNDVRIELYSRDRQGKWILKFKYDADPSSYFIEQYPYRLPVTEIVYSGKPAECVDIVLIPEGYSAEQSKKFEADCEFFASALLSYSPFKENSRRVNIRSVWAPSAESGVTVPGDHSWKQTAAGAKFYTFGTDRYQMIDNLQQLKDIAGNAPYDYIYVLSNTQKYGGGGIYNFYGISSASRLKTTGAVYTHEFGHLFAGLGDEYVGGTDTEDFYRKDVEPWEPNLTTLVDFDRKPWKALLGKEAEIPTPAADMQEDRLGVYEGGGYLSKGVYRPWPRCMMNDLYEKFCPVCAKAINDIFNFQCE